MKEFLQAFLMMSVQGAVLTAALLVLQNDKRAVLSVDAVIK